jgi:hypothetical protein
MKMTSADEFLVGRSVQRICRPRNGILLIEFADGRRLLLDRQPDRVLEFSTPGVEVDDEES